MLKRKHAQSGFTLVEMMVVAGVISVLAVGFAAYMYQQTKHLNIGQNRDSINQLQMRVLASSGNADVLDATDALQIQDFGSTFIPCDPPCTLMMDGGVLGCHYDCSSSGHSGGGTCPVLPANCTYLGIGH